MSRYFPYSSVTVILMLYTKNSKLDQWGVTTVLLVSDWTSAVAGVFCWVQDAALGLWAAACSVGCCGSNRWLYCGSSGYLLYYFWGWWSGDRLSFEPWCACQAWQHLGDVHECGLMLICAQLHQWLWQCGSHDWLHILQWQGTTVSCHCLIQKQTVLHRLGLFCSNLHGHG